MISSLFAKTGTDAPTAEPSLDAQSGVASGGQSSSPDESASDDRGPPEQELPLDVTFEILKNRRRRLVLDYLREADETVRIGELAEHIDAIENDIPVQQLNSQQRKRVYIGLYQCHLPKMDDAGVVDFNQDRGLVDLTDAATPLYAYLDAGDGDEGSDADVRVYGGLAVATAVLFGVAQFLGASVIGTLVVFGFLGAVLFTAVRDMPSSA